MSDLTVSQVDSAREVNRWRGLEIVRTAGYALLVGAAYWLGAKLGFALTFQPHPVSTLWPPNAILLASLLLAPTRLVVGLLAGRIYGPSGRRIAERCSDCAHAVLVCQQLRRGTDGRHMHPPLHCSPNSV